MRTLGERVNLVITEQNIDTSTSYGEMFMNLLGTFAQFETNLRKERQLEGIAKLKAKVVTTVDRKPSTMLES